MPRLADVLRVLLLLVTCLGAYYVVRAPGLPEWTDWFAYGSVAAMVLEIASEISNRRILRRLAREDEARRRRVMEVAAEEAVDQYIHRLVRSLDDPAAKGARLGFTRDDDVVARLHRQTAGDRE